MRKIVAILGIILLAIPYPVQTFAFDPNYVLSDWDMTDSSALDLGQIEHILDRGYLGDYRTEDAEGVTRTAGEIIYNAAHRYSINPKFLLVLIQKEQSLVEDPEPDQSQLDWAAGYGVCDNCSHDDGNIQRWRGFGKQINSAALQFREGYLADIAVRGLTQGKYGPDIAVTIDDTTVIPENAATASMYAYTPHLHGNLNFTKIWDRWFGYALDYPSGTLLKTASSPDVYVVQFGYKRHIKSWSALVTRYDPSHIIEINRNVLDLFPDGNPIGLPNYSLLEGEDGTRYLLVNDTLRPFESADTYKKIGFSEDELVELDESELEDFAIGDEITLASQYPQGVVMKLPSGSTFYVQDGVRHLVADPLLQATTLHGMPARPTPAVEIEQYREGKPITLPDGYLIKTATEPNVYVIENGLRREIPSESVFLSYGYSWDDIMTVSESVIRLHKVGSEIDGGGLNIAGE